MRQGLRCLGALIVVAVLVSNFLPAFQSTRRRPLPPAVKKIREIERALAQYHYERGHLPFDERGPSFALYKLHTIVAADVFLLNEDAKVAPPKWDRVSQQLQGGDVIYINQPLSNVEQSPRVFMAKPRPGEKWTWTGHCFWGPRSAQFAVPPDERILGSFSTVDNFDVVGHELFEDLAITHVVAGHSWTTTSHNDTGLEYLVSAQVAGRFMRYKFDKGRLVRCVIDVPAGEIMEEFETDELGQITAVRRTPENWRQLLGEIEDDQDNKGSR